MIRRSRGGILSWFDRRAVERALGGALPREARDLRYVWWQPSPDLAYHEVLVRFRTPREIYLDFARDRGWALLSETGPTADLPVPWSAPPEIQRPDWWDPTPATPLDAASGRVGACGSVVAKWEGGHVFLHLTDTGHRN